MDGKDAGKTALDQYLEMKKGVEWRGIVALVGSLLLAAVARSPGFKLEFKEIFGQLNGNVHNGYIIVFGEIIVFGLFWYFYQGLQEVFALRQAMLCDSTTTSAADARLRLMPFSSPEGRVGFGRQASSVVSHLVYFVVPVICYATLLYCFLDLRRPEDKTQSILNRLSESGRPWFDKDWQLAGFKPVSPFVDQSNGMPPIYTPLQTWLYLIGLVVMVRWAADAHAWTSPSGGIAGVIRRIWSAIKGWFAKKAGPAANNRTVVQPADHHGKSKRANKRARRRLAVIAALIFVTNSGCVRDPEKANVAPSPPKDSGRNFELPPTESWVSFAVDAPAESLRALVDQAIPPTFPVRSKGDVDVHGDLAREPIQVRIDESSKRAELEAKVSGKVQVEADLKIAKPSVGVNVSGTIRAGLSPVAAENWTFNPRLELDAHLDKATTKLPVINKDYDVAGIVRPFIQEPLNKAKEQATAEVKKAFDVRKDVERAWGQLSLVHRLSTSPVVWLRVTPKRVTFGQFAYQGGKISSGVAIGVESHVFVQETAPQKLAATLPKLDLAEKLPGGFDLTIPIEVAYASINQQLQAQFAKAPLQVEGDVSVKIQEAKIRPHGDGVLLTLGFQARQGDSRSASGTLYVTGIPSYDPKTSRLSMEQLDYTVETRDVLLKVANWLAHTAVLAKMQEAAFIDLAGETEKAKQQANKELDGIKKELPKEVAVDASVKSLTIDRIAFAKDRAFAVVKATGYLTGRLK